jgi:orotidine-5'-phosphate decarboxylase
MESVGSFAANPKRKVEFGPRHSFHSSQAVTRPASAKDRIIAAIDVPDEASALGLIRRLRGRVGFFKLGLELFTACGPEIVEKAKQEGEARIFLDLKFHDIPNTVAGAVRSASALGVDMLTIHLAGGGAMLAAAAASVGASTLLLGVSVLTSHSAETQREIGADADIASQVNRLVGLGVAHGIRGFVASGHEISSLRAAFGHDVRLVIPGLRPSWTAAKSGDDQKRVMTPAKAVAVGADFLVIGRPITGDPDPGTAADRIAAELAGA